MKHGARHVLVVVAWLLVPQLAEANILCEWFGRCYYESPGFQLTVVDKETGQPLAEVHALAEWVQYGLHGRNGPLMVQDAVSGPDGVLEFPAWGPIRGSRAGLVINTDPAISLFKPGYKVLLLHNAVPIGTNETDRVRGFALGIQRSALDPFRESDETWLRQLDKAAYPGTKGRVFDEQLLEFRVPYLNRMKRVEVELEKLSQGLRDVQNLSRSVREDIRFYERGGR